MENRADLNERHISQDSALQLLTNMGYKYISREDCVLQRGSQYQVLLKDILRGQLRKLNRYRYAGVENEFSAANIERAITELDVPLTKGLVQASEEVYDALMLGKSYPETVGEGRLQSFDLKYIDWEHPENNVLHVTEEFQVESADKLHKPRRPDIVLFINGIPFAIIECKASAVSCEQGIEETIRNQKPEYIPQLYKFAQIIIATNKNDGRYATTGTPKKFWELWREEDTKFLTAALQKYVAGRLATEQDKLLCSLLSPERIWNLLKYFILYDANIKMICRYQQYFAVQNIVATIQTFTEKGTRMGGTIWHTQGSGKSLTMVMLAKYLLTEMAATHPRVIIVTDRKELDKQIAKTFAHTRLKPARATSGRNLASLLQGDKADIITAIINKFNTVEKIGVVDDSRELYVLVDESHRSNYDTMSARMRTVLPKACFIGFTGTPLMGSEKSTIGKFGAYIHKYTIQQGVEDGAIVPLIYEGRFVEQNVDETNIDLWFEQTTKRLTPQQKKELVVKWSSVRRLTSTNDRIKRIALDINEHFVQNFLKTGFKAMLATNFKRDAVRYLECFEQLGDIRCGVVISAPDDREGFDDIYEEPDDKVKAFWNKMMQQYGDADTYEETLKNKFLDGEIDILIVCSKLLTGFDAPRCQVMYLDKELQKHALLQAVARTNRIYEGKDFGLIVDYRGLVKKVDEAMDMYSGAGLEDFNQRDLQGVLVDIMTTLGAVRDAYSRLQDLFLEVVDKQDVEALEVALADNKKREDFYNCLCDFGRELNLLLSSEKAYTEVAPAELNRYKEAFGFYQKLRRSVKLRYSDGIDNKEYEARMQNLLDTYLSVAGIKQITKPINILHKDEFEEELKELGTDRARADAIKSRMTKSISVKYNENPAYYASFSKRIKDTLDQYKDHVITEAEYLEKMRTIMEDYRQGRSEIIYPESIKNNVHAQAFYGVIVPLVAEEKKDNRFLAAETQEPFGTEEYTKISMQDFCALIAIEIVKIVKKRSKVDMAHNQTIRDQIAQDIDDLFFECEKKYGIKFAYATVDKIIDNIETVALRRF